MARSPRPTPRRQKTGASGSGGGKPAGRGGRRRTAKPTGLRGRLEAMAASRRSRLLLALVAGSESFVFPVPPDILLIPMAIAQPRQWFRIAAIATLAATAGALAGYAIGALAWGWLGEPLLETYGYFEKFEGFSSDAARWGAWAVFIAAVTPFPFKIATILSGASGLNLPIFVAACLLGRGLRFGLVAWFVHRAGPAAASLIEKHLGWVGATLLVAAVCVALTVVLLP